MAQLAATDKSRATPSTPKPEAEGANGEDGDQAMDDEEPAAVDARSVYLGNVSSFLLFSDGPSEESLEVIG